jgi:hypothetical protein
MELNLLPGNEAYVDTLHGRVIAFSLAEEFEWLILFDCIGRNCITDEIFRTFLLR